MAGVADTAFRQICKQFGAAYVVGEMASAKGLCMSDRKTKELLSVSDIERPMAIQLFGDEPETMAEAAKRAMAFRPDFIDINMGCPAPKVAGNGGGCALMKNPALAGRIIEAVSKAVPVPVTVKIRKGWDGDHVNAVEMAKTAEASGASAIAVHGRTREQMYMPPVDLDIIARVKQAVSIPVIGNGDIHTPEDVKRMAEQTGCDFVMVGRGALGSPWIFSQIESYFKTGSYQKNYDAAYRMEVMLRHIRLICEYKGEPHGIREARKHASWYMKGLNGASSFRKVAGLLSSLNELENLAREVVAQNTETQEQ